MKNISLLQGYIYLILAIIAGIASNGFLKTTEGFTKFNSTFVVSLINWRNLFTINVIGSKGSLHIENLCKWGPSKLYVRQRKFPSGYPKEKVTIIKSKDPTWKREEIYFKSMCKKKTNNLVMMI